MIKIGLNCIPKFIFVWHVWRTWSALSWTMTPIAMQSHHMISSSEVHTSSRDGDCSFHSWKFGATKGHFESTPVRQRVKYISLNHSESRIHEKQKFFAIALKFNSNTPPMLHPNHALYSLSGKTSCNQISWNIESARYAKLSDLLGNNTDQASGDYRGSRIRRTLRQDVLSFSESRPGSQLHYNDVIRSAMAYQITSLTIV